MGFVVVVVVVVVVVAVVVVGRDSVSTMQSNSIIKGMPTIK